MLQPEDRKEFKLFKQSLWKLIIKYLHDWIQKYLGEKTGENKRRQSTVCSMLLKSIVFILVFKDNSG